MTETASNGGRSASPIGRCLRAVPAPLVQALAAFVVGAITLAAGVGWEVALAVMVTALLPSLLLEVHGREPDAGRVRRVRRQPAAGAWRLLNRRDDDVLQSVLDGLRAGILLVDDNGVVLFANPAATSVLRAGTDAAVGECLWDVLSPDLHPCVRRALAATGDEAAASLPFRVSAVACGEAVFDVSAARAWSRSGEVAAGTALLFVDATRTREQVQLKDSFLARLARELQTLLDNLRSYSRILANPTPGKSLDWSEFARGIDAKGSRLAALMEQVVDLLEIESGKAPMAPVAVDLVDLARAAFVCARQRAAERWIELDFVADKKELPALADRHRLTQVCDLLIGNGLELTPREGRVRVRVTTLEGKPCLRVDDSGMGGPQQVAAAREPGSPPDDADTRLDGSGLGLATSRAIVARLGGSIWCEESEFGGAALVVVLPPPGGRQRRGALAKLAGVAD